MDVPWERSAPNRLNPSMALADASTDDTAGAQVSIAFNPARAEKLFEGSGHTLAEVLKIADEGKALPHFPLPTSMKATVTVDSQAVESQNVVGVVKGSDPELADEYVVLTAHLDHLGVGAAINGDSIYNGAMDNASGIATLIEIGQGRGGGAAEALGAVRGGDGGGEGAARLALLLAAPHRAARPIWWPTSTWTCSCRCSR